MSIQEITRNYIIKNNKESYDISEIHKHLLSNTDYNMSSITGSTFISEQKSRKILRNTEYIKKDNKIIKDTFVSPYNNQEKDGARKYIFKNLQKNDKVLTLGGYGDDNNIISSKTSNITNIEKDTDIKSNYHTLYMSMNTFLKNNKEIFDIINYDTVSYLCESVSKDIFLLNKSNAKEILITLIKTENGIRNHGTFKEKILEEYSKPYTLNYLKKEMNNYDLISTKSYRKNKKSYTMKIYRFKKRADFTFCSS